MTGAPCGCGWFCSDPACIAKRAPIVHVAGPVARGFYRDQQYCSRCGLLLHDHPRMTPYRPGALVVVYSNRPEYQASQHEVQPDHTFTLCH